MLDENPVLSFTSEDLAGGRLRYSHNNDESVSDSIDLRVRRRKRRRRRRSDGSGFASSSVATEGEDDVLVSFPITIVPLDDKAPLLIANLGNVTITLDFFLGL